MAILDNYASDFVGPAALPRPRTVFTPAAFAQATSIADRARLASSNLKSAISFADSESKMRDFILKGQEQDSRAAELYQEAELRAMQPAIQKELSSIDPSDDDAFEKLSDMKQYALSPDVQRQVSSRLANAGMIRREKIGLLEKMQQGGVSAPTMEAKLKEASAQFKAGDSLAFQKAATGVQTHNQAEAARKAQTRPQYIAEKDYSKAMEDIRAFGFSQDLTKAEKEMDAKLTAAQKNIKGFNAAEFKLDPDTALLGLPLDSSNKLVVDMVKNLAGAVKKLKVAKEATDLRNQMVVEQTEQQNPVAATPQNAYIQQLLQSLKQ